VRLGRLRGWLYGAQSYFSVSPLYAQKAKDTTAVLERKRGWAMSEKILYSEDAERFVLSAVLIAPAIIEELALKPSDFYRHDNATIYAAMLKLAADGEPLDYGAVKLALEKEGKLERAGGESYIMGLLNLAPNSLSAPYYAEIVKDYAKRRKALEITNKLATAAYDPKADLEAVAADTVNALNELAPQENQDARPRYTVRGYDFYIEPREPISYILDGLIAEQSVSLYYGKFGAKKTWALLDLAVCVASGKQWLGMDTQKCPVLIIDEESGERRLADRLQAILKGELVSEPVPIMSVSVAGFNFREKPDDIDALTALIAQTEAKLVVIDALTDVMLGGDENAVKDTQPVFTSLRRASELTGAAFIVIHHANKLGGYRGSSAIAGSIDNMVNITSEPESDIVSFKTEKVRDGEPINFAGRAVWTDGQFYMQPAEYGAKAILTKSQQYVLNYFRENGDATLKQLDDYSSDLYAFDTLKKAVQYLVNNHLLTRKDDGGKRVEATYGLPEAKG